MTAGASTTMPNPEHPRPEVVEGPCDERRPRAWLWQKPILWIVFALGPACGPSVRPAEQRPAARAPLGSPSTSGTRAKPPVRVESKKPPVELETKNRAEAPRPVCRLLACSNRLILFGEAPGGFRGDLELEVCSRERCESRLVHLPRVKKEGQVRVDGLLSLVVSAPQHCPLVLMEDCGVSSLGQRISRQLRRDSLLVFVIDAQSTGRGSTQMRVALTKDGATNVLLDGPVDFTTDSSCSRPNGSACEPECCTAAREF